MRCSFCWKSAATKPLAPDAVDVDPAGAWHRVDDLLAAPPGRAAAAVSSTARASLKAIVAMIWARSAPGWMSPPTTRASTGSTRRAASAASLMPQLRVAGRADRPAEPDHGGLGGLRGRGEIGDRAPGRVSRICQHNPGHTLLGRRQCRQQPVDLDDETGRSFPRVGSSRNAQAILATTQTLPPPRIETYVARCVTAIRPSKPLAPPRPRSARLDDPPAPPPSQLAIGRTCRRRKESSSWSVPRRSMRGKRPADRCPKGMRRSGCGNTRVRRMHEAAHQAATAVHPNAHPLADRVTIHDGYPTRRAGGHKGASDGEPAQDRLDARAGRVAPSTRAASLLPASRRDARASQRRPPGVSARTGPGAPQRAALRSGAPPVWSCRSRLSRRARSPSSLPQE